jgi:hypothetical protein
MSSAEHLRARSVDYELLAEWHAERAPVDDQHLVACQGMLVVGIVPREVAEAIDLGEAGGGHVLGAKRVLTARPGLLPRTAASPLAVAEEGLCEHDGDGEGEDDALPR